MNIYIGRDDEKKFNSICNLVQNGFIDKNIIEKVDVDNRIIYETGTGNQYIYDEKIKSISAGTSSSSTMLKEGASWFGFFHGKKIDSGKAAWTTLIESVAQNYHSKYSFLEFEQKDGEYNEEKVLLQEQIIDSVMNNFFVNIANYEKNRVHSKAGNDDVFCASMKMEIDDGGRQTTPILCKVFFRQRGEELIPIIASDALEIDTSLKDIITDYDDDMGSGLDQALEENSKVIIRVVNAIDKLINTPQFVKSVVYNSQKDYDDVSDLVQNGPNSFVKLECKNAKIIGISHVVWKNDVFEVKYNGKKVLRFIFGIKNKLSVACINCGNTLLIDNNRIDYSIDGQTKEVLLDIVDVESFGLTSEIIEEIVEYSEIKDHLFYIGCSSKEVGSNRACNRICCEKQVIDIDGVRKCKDCPIPEVIYRTNQGEIFLTSTVDFARDEMMLKPITKDGAKILYTCECCGRQFASMADKYRKYCKFCNEYGVKNSSTYSEKVSKEGKLLYSQYRGMLPFTLRLVSLFKPKYAFEEVDVILFKIGDSKYIVDKLDFEENGYLNAPRKVKDR